jgi:hypothetical protein
MKIIFVLVGVACYAKYSNFKQGDVNNREVPNKNNPLWFSIVVNRIMFSANSTEGSEGCPCRERSGAGSGRQSPAKGCGG